MSQLASNDVFSDHFQSKCDPYFRSDYRNGDYAPWFERPKRRGLHMNFVSARSVLGSRARSNNIGHKVC